MSCGVDTSKIRVKKAKAVSNGFLILLENGDVFVCGTVWKAFSPSISPIETNIEDIIGYPLQVVLIDKLGKTFTHGRAYQGLPTTPKPTNLDIKKIDKVVTTQNAFAVLKKDGTVINWGAKKHGGDTTEASQLKGIDKIVSNANAFAALDRDTHTLTIWGSRINDNSSRVDVPAERLSEVKDIVNFDSFLPRSTGNFLIRKTDGSNIIWGDYSQDYFHSDMLKDVKKILKTGCHSTSALAALKFDGTVEVWGHDRCGGRNNTGVDLTDVKDISSSGQSFHAIKNDGRVVSWGQGSKPRPK